MLWAIDYLCLALVLACAVFVVIVRNLNAAVVALSGVGTVLTVLFVVLGAPDDAHSEIVVGAIALPTLYLVAIGKVRTAVEKAAEEDLEEEGDDEKDGRSAESERN
jgi:energy-converting hydrogenase B subunit D